jgi:hypothetical protein
MILRKRIPLLEIVVVSYKRVPQLQTLIYSLIAQTNKDFSIHVIHDGKDLRTRQAIREIKKQNPALTIKYTETDSRFNDYGHTLRSIGLRESIADYTLLTNDDNYYAPIFIEEMVSNAMLFQSDVVFCDMVHNHIFNDLPNPVGYQVLISEPIMNRIDMGCFIFKTRIGQDVGFNSRAFEADWDFFQSLLDAGAKYSKVEKVLFVHN